MAPEHPPWQRGERGAGLCWRELSARFSPGGWLSDVWEAFEQRTKVTEQPLPLLFAVHPLTPSLGWAFPTELERKNSGGFSEHSEAVLRKASTSK